MSDKPSFLRGVDADDEEKEVMSVLEDEPKDTPIKEASTEETPKEEENVSDETTKKEEKDNEDSQTEGKKDIDPNKAGDSKAKDEKPPVEEKKDDDAKKLENVRKKYKTVEELEKANLELTRALTKLSEDNKKAQTNSPQKSSQPSAIEGLKNAQLINPQIPKAENYVLSDGTYDLNSFMRDSFKSFGAEIQKNLLGGPLAAGLFTLLQEAITQEHSQTIDQTRRSQEAEDIWGQVKEKFPILSEKKELEELYSKAIYGEKYRRVQEAQSQGKDPEEMTTDDYIKLATDIVGGRTIEVAPVAEDATEKVKGQTVMSESGRGMSDVEQAIQGMMVAKSRQLF